MSGRGTIKGSCLCYVTSPKTIRSGFQLAGADSATQCEISPSFNRPTAFQPPVPVRPTLSFHGFVTKNTAYVSCHDNLTIPFIRTAAVLPWQHIPITNTVITVLPWQHNPITNSVIAVYIVNFLSAKSPGKNRHQTAVSALFYPSRGSLPHHVIGSGVRVSLFTGVPSINSSYLPRTITPKIYTPV